jgi:hypothetical protein
MNKIRQRSQRAGLPLLITLTGAFYGCAGNPPVDTLSTAEMAYNRAMDAKASEFAPLELRIAQEKLDKARAAIHDDEYEKARRLAEQARADARLAEAKARAEAAKKSSEDTRETIDTLRQEASPKEPNQ